MSADCKNGGYRMLRKRGRGEEREGMLERSKNSYGETNVNTAKRWKPRRLAK